MKHRLSPAALGMALALTFAALVGPAGAQGIAGPYLAAKQAEARGDVAAAARLYAKSLAREFGDLTSLPLFSLPFFRFRLRATRSLFVKSEDLQSPVVR